MAEEEKTESGKSSKENAIRKKDLFDYVAANTSLSKSDCREAVESTLTFLRDVLAEEKEVIVPPLGKINSKRVKIGTPDEKVVYKLKLRGEKNGL